MKIGYKLLHEKARPPEAMTDGAVGFDLYVSEIKDIDIGLNCVTYGTGIALEFPKDYYCDIRARSSIGKTGYVLANGVGTVDTDYRGELMLKFYCVNQDFSVRDSHPYKPGDRCGQIVFFKKPKIELVPQEELSQTKRGKGGFGSTDEVKDAKIQN